jgi:ribosome-binding protein aMBF1 (putative translation factor)
MRLCSALKFYRLANQLSLRTLAKEIGISYSVLDRFERGTEIESCAWVRIFLWLLARETRERLLNLKPTKKHASKNA